MNKVSGPSPRYTWSCLGITLRMPPLELSCSRRQLWAWGRAQVPERLFHYILDRSLHLSGTVFHLWNGVSDSPALPTSQAAMNKLLKGGFCFARHTWPLYSTKAKCAEDPLCAPHWGPAPSPTGSLSKNICYTDNWSDDVIISAVTEAVVTKYCGNLEKRRTASCL